MKRTGGDPTNPSRVYASWDASLKLSELWQQMAGLGTLVPLRPGCVLFHQGAHAPCFYRVRSGFVDASVVRRNGKTLLLEIFGPGAMFGEGAAFTGLPHTTTVTAVSYVELIRYEPEEIRAVAHLRPDLAISLIELLGVKNRVLVNKLTRFASGDPEERLVELLARIAASQRHVPGSTTTVSLTHEQLGEMAGLSRVTVTRKLKLLACKGLVSTHPSHVEIIDHEGLIRLLGSK
ncbi:MAG: Crp/Fnr family transcriptional regulator [Ottowia sp.]|uniref:Crp/Fnr family transcriptional regulator n=1 Tax=Ottowia sp. TaxID=1898956 RepID=UPI0039E40C71